MKRFLVGKRISLHGLTSNDITEDSPYFQWLDDMDLDIYTERSYFPNTPTRMREYLERAHEGQSLVLLGIFDNETGKHIGNITFQEISWIAKRASLGFLLGDKNFHGKGIARDATLMMLYYGFNKLNFHRIFAGISDLNGASKKVCQNAGMQLEGRFRDDLYRNGEFSDSLIYASIREEWMETHGQNARDCFEILPTY